MLNIGTCVNYLCNPNMLNEISIAKKKPISVTFCVPGKSFSQGFIHSWTKLLFLIKDNPEILEPHFSNLYNEDYVNLMNEILGGDINQGKYQLPFENDFDCDFIFFIDSDISFDTSQVLQIIYKMVKFDLDVLTGVYYEKSSEKIPVVNYKNNDGSLNYHTKQTLIKSASNANDNVFEVDNIDLCFACIKNRIFKYIEYPWFEENPDKFLSENNLLIEKIKKSGSKIHCDPSIFVKFDI